MNDKVVHRLDPDPAPHDIINDAYDRLVEAIIESAVIDYKKALSGMLQAETRAVRKHHIDSKRQVEKFFRSEWFKVLCDINADAIMSALEKQVVAEELHNAKRLLRKALGKVKNTCGKENGI